MASKFLPTCSLGKDGPQVTALGFGAMGLSAPIYGQIKDDETRFNMFDRLHELGCTNWDTSDGYGDSEDMIGSWFTRTGKRNDIFVATKFGINRKEDGTREFRNEPEFIRLAIEKSLKRLQTDYIDLWYCHRFNGQVPVETIVQTMAEFVRAGKVKYLGLSECSASTLRRACKVWRIHAIQMEYSPFATEIESPDTKVLQACRELGVAVVAYSPLGRGMLTGKYRSAADFEDGDYRKTGAPRYSDENFAKNLELVDVLNQIAQRKECTTGQLTLAWLMKQGKDIIPIPGTKNIKYLEENLGALDICITKDEDQEVRDAIDRCEVHGDRYPGPMNNICFMDTPPIGTVHQNDEIQSYELTIPVSGRMATSTLNSRQ